MDTHPTLAEPSSPARPSVRPGPPSRRRGLVRAAYRALVLLLIGLNAWWFWRDRPPVELRTVDAWIVQGKVQEAEQALRDRLRRSPRDGEARTKLSQILGKRGDYLGLARQLHEVPAWWPTKGQALFMEGQAYKRLNRARDAEPAWLRCTADDPLHPVSSLYYSHAARELVALYLMEDRLDEARDTLRRAYVVADPSERPGILIMRMAMELNRISHEESLGTLRQYVAADPADWEARRGLALEELAARQEATASRLILECQKARPADVAVCRTALEISYQKGDREAIKAALARLPAGADADAEIWKFRGLGCEWNNDMPGAAEAYRRAAALNPAEGEYLYKLGVAEQRAGQTGQAEQHIRRSQELRTAFPKFHDAYFDFLDILKKSHPGNPDYNAAVERLAGFCDLFGWKPEAQAWRQIIAAG